MIFCNFSSTLPSFHKTHSYPGKKHGFQFSSSCFLVSVTIAHFRSVILTSVRRMIVENQHFRDFFDDAWMPAGCLLEASGCLWGASGCLLGASWGPLGGLWGPLGCLWVPLGGLLGASWRPLGASWVPLGASWALLGGLIGPSGGFMGASRCL